MTPPPTPFSMCFHDLWWRHRPCISSDCDWHFTRVAPFLHFIKWVSLPSLFFETFVICSLWWPRFSYPGRSGVVKWTQKGHKAVVCWEWYFNINYNFLQIIMYSWKITTKLTQSYILGKGFFLNTFQKTPYSSLFFRARNTASGTDNLKEWKEQGIGEADTAVQQ